MRNLTRKQEHAITALLSTRSIEEAAKACHTPVRTLYRWLDEPGFNAAYRSAKRKVFGQVSARLQQACGAAGTTLVKVMVDPATPPATKVRAAECVLSHGTKALEIEDIEARLAELERGAQEARNHD